MKGSEFCMRVAERFNNFKPSGMMRMFRAIAQTEGVLNLSIGEPDFTTEPDVIDAAARAARAGSTHYPPLQGFRDLREAVCGYWERRHGLSLSPAEVVIANGALQATQLLFEALLDPGDEVLLLEPYFTVYAVQVRDCGGVPVGVPTREENNFAPTAEDLEAAVTSRTRGIVVNSPGNPSGSVYSREQLEVIAAFAAERDLLVISDEIYESLVFHGEHVCFASLPGMRERTITIGGVSKSHCMTGWRLGYAMTPPDVASLMCLLSSSRTYGVCTLAQKGAAYALNTQDAKVEERRAAFGDRLRAVEARLNAMKGVRCRSAAGAFYLFPDISGTGLSSEEFSLRALREARVGLLPGDAFGESGEGYVRIACTQAMDSLMRAMDALERFTDAL